MKRELDDILKYALKPTDEPEYRLNLRILNQVKEENRMKREKVRKIMTAVAASVLVVGLSSLTAVAAWKYLSADKVMEKMEQPKLRDAFLSDNAVMVNETQSYGKYEISLLGIVSGKELTQTVVRDGGSISDDKTYYAVAISRADGTPMPETSSDDYNEVAFFVSPLIKGYDPAQYNVMTMGGGYQDIVEDGILYRLGECDNVEMFADCGLYLCVLDNTFYDAAAYRFERSTGEIFRNKEYAGVNALFDLPIDVSKADPGAVKQYLVQMQEDADETFDYEPTDADRWMEQITPENIDEYAKPVESTRKTVTPNTDGTFSYSYELPDGAGSNGEYEVAWVWPDGKPGMCRNFSYSYGGDGENLEGLVIEVLILNEDGTVTGVAYVPK